MPDTELDLARLALALSCAAVAAVAVAVSLRARRRVRALATAAFLTTALWWVYSITFPQTVRSRGETDAAALVVSYLAMVMGMVAHHVYTKAEQGATRLTIDWMRLLMPVMVSPIVFIPLMSIAAEVSVTGGMFTRQKVMVYLVAFQNGFFWKHFFDQRHPAASPASPTP
jgi:hypothetical protein